MAMSVDVSPTEKSAKKRLKQDTQVVASAYMRRIWLSVLMPVCVDLTATALIISVIWAIAQCLVLMILHRIGITASHISEATALLGLLYLAAITVTMTRRFYYSAFRDMLRAPTPPLEESKPAEED
ncbi:MAG: hypothetical protein HOO88_01105 [Kiritimatiellaceae bacterium]|nr:hypothetical protein [Kiritimatiellaceae bacterium]